MAPNGIGGRTLKVQVVGCTKLKDTEWITKQDPYVRLEYCNTTKFETRVIKGGHKSPYFKEDFEFTLIEGLPELNVTVWNKRTLTKDDFIGSVSVRLEKVLSNGIDEGSWSLVTFTGRKKAKGLLFACGGARSRPSRIVALCLDLQPKSKTMFLRLLHDCLEHPIMACLVGGNHSQECGLILDSCVWYRPFPGIRHSHQTWVISIPSARFAGEIQLVLHYPPASLRRNLY